MRRTLVIAVLISACSVVTAQEEDVLRPNGRPGVMGGTGSATTIPFVLGIEGGLNVNFFSADYTSIDEFGGPGVTDSPDNVLASAMGLSPEFGVFADIGLSEMFGLQFRLAYDRKVVSNTETHIIDAPLVPGVIQGFPIEEMQTEANWCLGVNNLAIAALFRVDIVDELFATVGPIALIQVGDATRTDKLTQQSPEGTFITLDYEGNQGQFSEIEREITGTTNILPVPGGTQNQDLLAYNSARFGLEFGLGYRFMISETIYIAPNLRYQLLFTPQNDEYEGLDLSREPTQSVAISQYSASTLNTLAVIIQLGFEL